MNSTRTLRLASASLLCLLGGEYLLAQNQPKLTRFLDAWPGSLMATVTGDRRADWVFIGEGGTIAFVDLRGTDSNSNPSQYNPFSDPNKMKRVRTGTYAVRASALLLDRDADLSVDTDLPPDGISSNDREDILYIAAGRFGLWAMRAETTMTSTTWNSVVRLDDSADNTPGNQSSKRFCNQLEFANVNGVGYLLATFAEKDGGNTLRFYPLSGVRDRLDWNPPAPPPLQGDGTGWEITATWSVTLGERSGFPFVAWPETKSEAFALGIAVDYPLGNSTTCSAVYVAMGSHGVVRVEPTFAPGTTTVNGWTTAWGPVFGDGSFYALNAPNGHLYTNLDYRTMARTVRFDTIDRTEPPIFTDVAVQHELNESDGPSILHYLYCTVDHINWVRFNLSNAWSNSIPIDHHEGDPIAIERKPSWFDDQGVQRLSSYGGYKEMMRATDLFPFDNTQAGQNRMDTTFARRVELVDPPAGSAFKNKLVVVTASGGPFLSDELVNKPRASYDYTFQFIGGINLECGGHLAGQSKIATTIIYDSTELSGFRSEIGYITSGGTSLYVPSDQSTSGDPDTIKLVHNNLVDGGPDALFNQGGDGLNETCLTFYDLASPPNGVAYPTFVRNSTSPNNRGRYNNGFGYCISDPRILTSSHNDGLPYMDGILWTRPQGNTVVVGNAVPPTASGDDRRMETGIVCPQNNQWHTDDDDGGNANFKFHYIAGQGRAPNSSGLFDVGWSIVRHTVEVDTSTFSPAVTWDWLRVFDLPESRWRHTPRGGYTTASTTDEAFTAWALQAPSTAPKDYVFFAQAGTADGIYSVDRSGFMADVLEIGGTTPPQVGTSLRDIWPTGYTRQFRLNTHPEWDPIPAANAVTDASCLWWRTRPVIDHQGTSVTWTPLLLNYPLAVSSQPVPKEEWILAVPCFALSNPHAQIPLTNLAGTAGGFDLDQEFAGWFAATNVDAETGHLMSKYGHGLVQFWRFTHRPATQGQMDVGMPTTEPPGTSVLPYIVLPDPGSCAWEIESATVGTGASTQVLLFVADFGGRLYVYDVTEVPDTARDPANSESPPIATWTAPKGIVDDLHSNVRAIAVDRVSNDLVRAYVGVPGVGIEVLDLDRSPGTNQWAFDPVVTHIETPGDPYGLAIRPADAASGALKVLLVSDSFAGLRVYGEEQAP